MPPTFTLPVMFPNLTEILGNAVIFVKQKLRINLMHCDCFKNKTKKNFL